MSILVTAFAPFGGRSQNAAALALQELIKSHPELHHRILPVDSVLAPARLKQAILETRPDALIMLGEAADTKSIRLETTAWNNLDFRIPDAEGLRPRDISIQPGGPERLFSTLPLANIHSQLSSMGHPVSLSDDPGRYLCNQIFFTALGFLKSESIGIPAGFIHLPLEVDYPTEKSATAIAEVIRLLIKSPS
jgi:pyroglutamyl-peptidase